MDCSPPGFSVHGISQARLREELAIFFSRGSSQFRDGSHVSCPGRRVLYHWATREAKEQSSWSQRTVALPSLTNIMKICFLYQDHQSLRSYPNYHHHHPNISISLPSGHTWGFDRRAPSWCCSLRWRHFISAPALQSSYSGATAVNLSLQTGASLWKYILYHTNTKGGNKHTLK